MKCRGCCTGSGRRRIGEQLLLACLPFMGQKVNRLLGGQLSRIKRGITKPQPRILEAALSMDISRHQKQSDMQL